MTYCSHELRAKGVHPEAISMRLWRRARGLTVRSMATMLGINEATLYAFETGKRDTTDDVKDAIRAFVERWEKVPAAREALDAEVRRSRLRYRVAALERCKARGFEVPGDRTDRVRNR